MTDNQLRQLVEDADAACAPSPPQLPRADNLLAALAARRRRRTRRRGVAATSALAIALVSWNSLNSREQYSPTRSLDVAVVRARLDELDRQADLHLRVVHGLADSETVVDSDAIAVESVGQVPEQFPQEVARSAAISWRYATLVEQEFGDAAAARRQYERVVARFPDTHWAQQAAESLLRLPATDSPRQL